MSLHEYEQQIKLELIRSALEDKNPLVEINIDAFYAACYYQLPYQENIFDLKDYDLRVYLLLCSEDI